MTALAYQRAGERFQVEAPVMIEDLRTGFPYDGIVCNYCAYGVYVESHYALRPGRILRLKFNGALDIFTARTCLAEVRWRRSLNGQSSHYIYGSGLKYC